ncbi:membrane-spanning 4-domains subfamily A member 15-like isoform X3 [Podarcis raffonei]|uniref:membrane-spanning 4-domains subfamily A member 15-like isoform X3 n=1 Tax=Podarcis raffonei TaxID=65483 RepID=UPI00232936E4|nr:membrane-spanning 4-domains subfamily A member 15-like isoform X3 [Podarcis raffonei]
MKQGNVSTFRDISAMTTDPVRRQNGIIAFILPNGADIIQAGQGIHATIGQQPGVAQYIDEQLGSNQPERKRWVRELEKKVKVEAKTLGAIQIMIGLIQTGFGIVSFFLLDSFYAPLVNMTYFPCWGGIFFIVSGSISVSTTKYRNRSLLFNKVGNGLCTVHLLFCLLEFCITVPTAHFGCQATCCNEMDMDLVPIVIVGDDVAPAENNPVPPAYSDIMLSPSVDG